MDLRTASRWGAARMPTPAVSSTRKKAYQRAQPPVLKMEPLWDSRSGAPSGYWKTESGENLTEAVSGALCATMATAMAEGSALLSGEGWGVWSQMRLGSPLTRGGQLASVCATDGTRGRTVVPLKMPQLVVR